MDKKQYEDIKAPQSLKDKVNMIVDIEMKTEKKNKPLKKLIVSVAASMLVCISAVNLFPNLVYATQDIPILNEIVRIVTFNRFEKTDKGYEANIVTPQIEGLLDKDLENELNQKFKDHSDLLITGFENDLKELKKEFGDEEVHMGVESSYTVKSNNEDFLSVDLYTLNTAGSSSTIHSFYNIDKHKNKIIELDDLFEKDSNYTEIISKYLIGEMERQMKEEDKFYWIEEDDMEVDYFKEIKSNQNFYINESNQLVITFDKYEIAPGAEGSPEFIIPIEVIGDILKDNSLIK